MALFENVIQRAAEKLYEDERLRSNLTDSEAKVVLDWATGWINERVSAARDEASAKQIAQGELGRVRQTVSAMNALAAKPGTLRLADAIATLDAALSAKQAYTREEVFALITALTSAAWKLRAGR